MFVQPCGSCRPQRGMIKVNLDVGRVGGHGSEWGFVMRNHLCDVSVRVSQAAGFVDPKTEEAQACLSAPLYKAKALESRFLEVEDDCLPRISQIQKEMMSKFSVLLLTEL